MIMMCDQASAIMRERRTKEGTKRSIHRRLVLSVASSAENTLCHRYLDWIGRYSSVTPMV